MTLNYYEIYYDAMSFFWLGQEEKKASGEKGSGYGKIVTCFNEAVRILAKVKGIEKLLVPAIYEHYSTWMKMISTEQKESLSDNSKIYFGKHRG